ncbi:MAG: ABC transporter ATP-binding protein [Desulfocapsaceae bacterium]|nr:ABC transporter ATP-binding protein [Desulfocapsaceae bacterium]
MALFEAQEITKTYQEGTKAITILKGIDLAVEAGVMTAIIGASGSGKSTLLKIMGTLEAPTSGRMIFQGQDLTRKNDMAQAHFRNRSLGFIFQFHHLLPEFSALENVMMPGLIAGRNRKEMEGPAMELLQMVEVDHRHSHRVHELSGGEQQRTALARALIMQPALLLADEPTGNLDSRAGNLVFDLLHRLCRERKLTALMVTHNMELAHKMDACLTLKDGILAG